MTYNDNEKNTNDLNEMNSEKQNVYEVPQTSYSYISSYTDEPNPKKKKKGKFIAKALGFMTAMAVVSIGTIQVYKYALDNDEPLQNIFGSDSLEDDEENSETDSTENEEDFDVQSADVDTSINKSLIELASRENAMSVPDIVESSKVSVVGISATFEYTSSNYMDFWGQGGGTTTQEIKGTGTGIIMTEDGYIITNAHVVYDTSEYDCGKATSISVVLSDEKEYEAKVIGCDVETDIAVLKIDADNLVAAKFGDSDDMRVGELVIAIGNPLGFELFGSVTSGIVSAVDREITVNEKQMNLIQIDAAINSGNSGGPLINSYGQVIGINSAKMSSSYSSSASIEGIGFAIPISEAKVIIDDLIEYGYVTGRPQIGVSTQDVTETISRFYGMPIGVYVTSVAEGSSAEWAGIKAGDIIIGAQDEAVTNLDELNEIKNQYKAGDEITLTISRGGEDIEISLVLQEQTEVL